MGFHIRILNMYNNNSAGMLFDVSSAVSGVKLDPLGAFLTQSRVVFLAFVVSRITPGILISNN